jgi:hypothetical protein
MNYVRQTASFGNVIKPNSQWNNTDNNFKFVVTGLSDSEYASDPDTRRSVSGGTVFLCGAVIFAFSRMQRCVTLSVTEAEFVAAVEVVQNMLFAWRVLSSMGLLVQLPMLIEVDNKGAVDLANSWSATGRTRHIASRINFLRELKEEGIITVQWISSTTCLRTSLLKTLAVRILFVTGMCMSVTLPDDGTPWINKILLSSRNTCLFNLGVLLTLMLLLCFKIVFTMCYSRLSTLPVG